MRPQPHCARSRSRPKSPVDEFEIISRYFDRGSPRDGTVVGIGDDGAVLSPTPGRQLVTVVDTLVEGVHFPLGFGPDDIGYRVVAVNLSDIAAMGAVPRWMTLALSMPLADEPWLQYFSEGLLAAAAEYGVELVGGDTTSAPQVVATVQMTGEVAAGRALLRSGAQAGDTIYVTGSVGDAAAGLHGLVHGGGSRALTARFSRPSARVRFGQSLVERASAAIDISDGLYADLAKLLAASGVGAEIDLAALPLSDALRTCFSTEQQRHFALHGGDDYELCFTAAGEVPDPGMMELTAIGTVTSGDALVCMLDGTVIEVDDKGYRHFE